VDFVWKFYLGERTGPKQRPMDILSLRVGGKDTHSVITAVHTLSLYESTLLFRLIAKADEAVSTGLAGHGIGDDLS